MYVPCLQTENVGTRGQSVWSGDIRLAGGQEVFVYPTVGRETGGECVQLQYYSNKGKTVVARTRGHAAVHVLAHGNTLCLAICVQRETCIAARAIFTQHSRPIALAGADSMCGYASAM